MREVQQTQIDVEDFFYIFNIEPKVKESPAVDFEYRGGAIEFKGVSFSHQKKTNGKKNGSDSEVTTDAEDASLLF